MSAMEQMAKNLLLSIIPAEVAGMLTEENLKKATATVTEFISEVRGNMQSIADEQAQQRAMLEGIYTHVTGSDFVARGGGTFLPSDAGSGNAD